MSVAQVVLRPSDDAVPGANDVLRRELVRVDRILLHEAERSEDPAAVRLARELATEHGARAASAPRLDAHGALPGIERARAVYRLSALEREALAIALVCEIDERYGQLFALLQREPERSRPSVGLVTRWLASLADGDLTAATSALGTDGHLYRTGLIELVGDGPRSSRALCLPEAFWPRLVGMASPGPFHVSPVSEGALARLVLGHATRTAAVTTIAWAHRRRGHEVLIIVDGAEHSGRESLAMALASELGFAAMVIDASQIETASQVRALAREAAWHLAAVVVRGPAPVDALARLTREISTPILVLAHMGALRELAATGPRRAIGVEIAPLEHAEREALWELMLGDQPHADDISARSLAVQFRFAPAQIKGIVAVASSCSEARGDTQITAEDLQAACRTSSMPNGSLATRVECPYDEADIVLPAATRRELSLILAWSRYGASAFQAGGAGSRIKGSSGLVCLFAGPPGTGKTMAAQILSRSLRLEMLRVDLSQVVNKYIGETEKNLERVFDEAEGTGALLFFDEADALFGKRTEVKDAHDRYANLETAFLLQRLERHPGVVILATNLQHNLDAAFLRRIQVIAEFPIPNPAERQAIWDRHLSRDHLDPDIDLGALAAMFPLAGGDIRNAVITAVLLAASDHAAISMRHLVIGVWRELHKTGRLMSPDDFGRWRDDVLAYVHGGRT